MAGDTMPAGGGGPGWVLGMSLFVGGLRHDLQGFSSQTASVHTSSAVAGFLMPALFVLSSIVLFSSPAGAGACRGEAILKPRFFVRPCVAWLLTRAQALPPGMPPPPGSHPRLGNGNGQ